MYQFTNNNVFFCMFLSFQILEYTQFYLDLKEANKRKQADWIVEYNFTSYYGLRNVSPASLHELAESFSTPEGTTNFQNYFSANSVRYHSYNQCDANCLRYQYCAITRVDYEDYQMCLATTQAMSGRAIYTHTPPGSFFLLFFVLTTLLFGL